MKFRKKPLAHAVSMATAAAGSIVLYPATQAVGQEGQGQQVLEEVVVTGTRISRPDLDSASPISVVDREAILAYGVTDVGNLIQKMPSMSGSPIGTTTNNGGNGAVLIDLRGLGTARTLTLVNGQRVVDGGDYQTIPSTMIERVEILKDGASAVYGADAVAGVVNIITRRDFEGIELNAQTADFADMKSGAQETIGLIAGANFGDGNFVFGAEYVNQEQAFQSDAPWDFFQGAYYIYPGGCERQVTAPYNGTPMGGCYQGGSSRIPESRLSFFEQGLFMIGTPATAPYEVGLMEPHDGRTYNYAPVNFVQTPYERTNLFAEGRFDLANNMTFSAEIRGNDRSSAQQLAPLPYTGGDPMYDGVFNGEMYSGISEDNYYLRRAVDAYNATGPETMLAYEPVVGPRRRMIETNRRFEQEISQYQWVASLEGTLDNDIDWNVYLNQGTRSRTDRDFGQFSGVRLYNALGPSADLDGDGRPECYGDVNDPTSLIVGCVPLNLFGGGEVDADSQPSLTTLTEDMVNYVSLDTVDTYIGKQVAAGFGLSGSAFDFGAGPVGWAAGYARWTQDFTYTPDSAKTIGAVTGNVGAGTAGTLTNDSIYGEFLAPVFDNGIQAVDVSGGIRYDDWDAFGSDTTWQAGIEIQATNDVKLRATAGTVFRAPTISNLFGGVVDSFPTYSDPCVPPAGETLPPGCEQVGIQTDSQVHALVGGNPNLTPESGNTLTAGAVWNAGFGNGDMTLTVDYWKTELTDGISSLGVQFILDDCYINQNAASCALITRTSRYDILTIRDSTLNVADQGAEGIDLEVRYNFDTDVGQFEAALLWTHLLGRTKTPFAGAPREELGGTYTSVGDEDGGAYPDNKANLSLQWYRDNFSIGWLGEFVGSMTSMTNYSGDYEYTIDALLYHDIVARYEFSGTGTEISLGVTNLSNEPPPYIDLGFNAGTDVAAYRLFGTGYYLRLTQRFE